MLRTLRTLWVQSYGQTGYDEVVHVVTVLISRHIVEAFVHWTCSRRIWRHLISPCPHPVMVIGDRTD